MLFKTKQNKRDLSLDHCRCFCVTPQFICDTGNFSSHPRCALCGDSANCAVEINRCTRLCTNCLIKLREKYPGIIWSRGITKLIDEHISDYTLELGAADALDKHEFNEAVNKFVESIKLVEGTHGQAKR